MVETLSGRMARPEKESDYCRFEVKEIVVFIQRSLLEENDGELSFSMMNRGPFTLTYRCEESDADDANAE